MLRYSNSFIHRHVLKILSRDFRIHKYSTLSINYCLKWLHSQIVMLIYITNDNSKYDLNRCSRNSRRMCFNTPWLEQNIRHVVDDIFLGGKVYADRQIQRIWTSFWRVQMTISQLLLRWLLGVSRAISHYLNQSNSNNISTIHLKWRCKLREMFIYRKSQCRSSTYCKMLSRIYASVV